MLKDNATIPQPYQPQPNQFMLETIVKLVLNPFFLGTVIFSLFFLYLRKVSKNPILVKGNFIAAYQFPTTLNAKVAEKYPQLNQQQVSEIIEGLRTYFQVCNMARNDSKEIAMPSQAVDEAWHQFILHTKAYADFCDQAFGRFLHHSPAEGMLSPTEAQDTMRHTFKQACRMYGISRKTPDKLPPLFTLDLRLNIPNGFIYTLDCSKDNNNDKFCFSHIGCTANIKK